ETVASEQGAEGEQRSKLVGRGRTLVRCFGNETRSRCLACLDGSKGRGARAHPVQLPGRIALRRADKMQATHLEPLGGEDFDSALGLSLEVGGLGSARDGAR